MKYITKLALLLARYLEYRNHLNIAEGISAERYSESLEIEYELKQRVAHALDDVNSLNASRNEIKEIEELANKMPDNKDVKSSSKEKKKNEQNIKKVEIDVKQVAEQEEVKKQLEEKITKYNQSNESRNTIAINQQGGTTVLCCSDTGSNSATEINTKVNIEKFNLFGDTVLENLSNLITSVSSEDDYKDESKKDKKQKQSLLNKAQEAILPQHLLKIEDYIVANNYIAKQYIGFLL